MPRRLVAAVSLLLGLVLATSGVLLGMPPAAAKVEGRDGARPVPVQARPADHLVEAFGVGTHLGYLDTAYADVDRVVAALTRLGVRHVRDNLSSFKPQLYAAMEKVADAGIGFNLVMGRPNDWDTPENLVQTLATELRPGVVESIEGANEWNISRFRGPDWVGELRRHQRALYAAAKAEPATAHLPVLAPALGMRTGFEELGDLGDAADIGNAHIYPGGQLPSTYLPYLLHTQRVVVPDAPVYVTESGYHNAMATPQDHAPTTESAAGIYLPRLLLEHFAAGTERLYVYELLDERPDPDKTNREMHFGLLRDDFTPKPAYDALRRLLALADDPGPSFTPGSLSYRVAQAPADLRQVLLQRRDGTFVLVMWRDVSVYDRVARRDRAVAPARVRVELAAPATVRVHRPSLAGGAIAATRGQTLQADVAGDVWVAEVDDGSPAPAPGAAPSAPGVPRSVSAVPGNSRVDLSWAPPGDDGGSPVLRYDVTGLPGFPPTSTPADVRKLRVKGLRNGTPYAIWVQAVTSAGPGAPVLVQGRPARTPRKPRAVTAKLLKKPGRVMVRWKPPKDDGGAEVERYRIREKRSGRVVRVDADTRNVRMRLPLSQRKAKFVVAARNDVGFGPGRGTGRIRLR